MNYTKGEWKVKDGTSIFCGDRLVANTGGYTLTQHETKTLKENKANAHLIAAAPLMYEALRGIVSEGTRACQNYDSNIKETYNIDLVDRLARKALALAEGGE